MYIYLKFNNLKENKFSLSLIAIYNLWYFPLTYTYFQQSIKQDLKDTSHKIVN